MSVLRMILGFVLVLAMDSGLALIISYIVNQFYHFSWQFYCINVLIVFAPDYDLIRSLMVKELSSLHKKTLFHQPYFMLLLGLAGGLVANLLFDFPWFVPPILLLCHFIHDSFEPLGVVAWKAPIVKDKFYRFYLTDKFPFIGLKEQAIDDLGFFKWVENYYTKLNYETISSFIVGLTGLLLFIKDVLK